MVKLFSSILTCRASFSLALITASLSLGGCIGFLNVYQVRIPVDRDRAFRFNVTEDSEFA